MPKNTIDAMQQPRGNSIASNAFPSGAGYVACPSCDKSVPAHSIQAHLNGCLNADMFLSEPSTPTEVEVGSKVNEEQTRATIADARNRLVNGGNERANVVQNDTLAKPGAAVARINGTTSRASFIDPTEATTVDQELGHIPKEVLASGGCEHRQEGVGKGRSNGMRSEYNPHQTGGAVNDRREDLFQVSDEQLEEAIGLVHGRSSQGGACGLQEPMRVTQSLIDHMARIHAELGTFSKAFKEPSQPLPTLETLGKSTLDNERVKRYQQEGAERMDQLRKEYNLAGPSNDVALSNQEGQSTCPVCAVSIQKGELQSHLQTCLITSGLDQAFQ